MTPLIKHSVSILVVGLSLFGACKQQEALPILSTDQVSLGVNKSARVSADITVRVDAVSDSRCPIDLQCFVAGDALVSLSLSNVAETQKRRLSLYGRSLSGRTDSTTVQFGSSLYSVVLRSVVPYPDLTKLQQERQAVIQVTKL